MEPVEARPIESQGHAHTQDLLDSPLLSPNEINRLLLAHQAEFNKILLTNIGFYSRKTIEHTRFTLESYLKKMLIFIVLINAFSIAALTVFILLLLQYTSR